MIRHFIGIFIQMADHPPFSSCLNTVVKILLMHSHWLNLSGLEFDWKDSDEVKYIFFSPLPYLEILLFNENPYARRIRFNQYRCTVARQRNSL